MTCPSCGGELVPGATRCPVCAASRTPRVEGALAADPRLLTPPARPRPDAEPIREIPALRKRGEPREKSWRDEVQERVRSRRQKRVDAGLPLFDQPDAAQAPTPVAPRPPAPAAVGAPLAPAEAAAEAATPSLVSEPQLPSPPPLAPREPDLVSTELSDDELADLPLRGLSDPGSEQAAFDSAAGVPSLDDDVLLGDDERDPQIELRPPAVESLPVERPARPGERAQAAALDGALFAAIGLVVVYFTGRAARVDLATLVHSWRWIGAYLGLLAVFYCGYFTGTTGQTPGKLAMGLRVVGTGGRPPGYAGAMGRGAFGLLGIALAGLGLVPIAFDPARRAAHDRLFRTRVVRG
jgi:uncharacterized RDD family membrane protein YckC